MTKRNILVATVIVLVVINLATLSFLWFTRQESTPGRRIGHPGKSEMILERRLKLNEHQLEAFKEARNEHFDLTSPIIESIHQNRLKINSAIPDNLTSDEIDSLADKVGMLTAQLEKYNFTHLQQLRAICDEKQREKFDVLTKKIFERGPRMRMKKRKGRRRN
ncbi:MAG: periplasmic heavy metal sensor [Bacteroidota bacterium]